MSMLVYGPDADQQGVFASSRARYELKSSSEDDPDERIHLRVLVRGRREARIEAVLDTGAPYCLIPPWAAELAQLETGGGLRTLAMRVRGGTVRGVIDRLGVRLLADEGKDVELDVTALILDPASAAGRLPAFVGLKNCLEAIRFGVDPFSETFYFGQFG